MPKRWETLKALSFEPGDDREEHLAQRNGVWVLLTRAKDRRWYVSVGLGEYDRSGGVNVASQLLPEGSDTYSMAFDFAEKYIRNKIIDETLEPDEPGEADEPPPKGGPIGM